MKNSTIRIAPALVTLVAAAGLGFAQTQSGGWRRIGDPPPAAPAIETGDPGTKQAPPGPEPPRADQDRRPMPRTDGNFGDERNYAGIPPRITLQPGTYITVRINQPLSSDRNQTGDYFSATLVKPVVVDGIVVAQRGQTVGGRVAEAQKAGHGGGLSRLGIQLIDLALVDGQQMPIQTSLMTRTGPSSVGRNASAIGTTTALGAATGAIADRGFGAGVGAAAGATVGIIGVLLTRGHPTIIEPETLLTFRVQNPVTISTERAPQAYRFVEPEDYDHPQDRSTARPAPPAPRPYGWYGPAYPYPYYWGPSIGFYYGPRFYGGYRYYGRRW